MRIMLCIIALLLILTPASAQDETFTWTPYDFTLTLPDGWTATESAERLVLGLPEDVDAVLAGEVAPGLVVTVQVVEPPQIEVIQPLIDHAPHYRPDVETRKFGESTWPVVDILPFGERQGLLVTVADTFLLSASAPLDLWPDVEPTINTLIAGIMATPAARSPSDRLTQPVAWRELTFAMPENWSFLSAAQSNIYTLTSLANHRRIAATFRQHELTIIVRDYSAVRHMITPDSLPLLRTFWYIPEDYTLGPIETAEVEGFSTTKLTFADDESELMGRAMLLLTPDSAYLFAGIAGQAQWQASEFALFEAIVATLRHSV